MCVGISITHGVPWCTSNIVTSVQILIVKHICPWSGLRALASNNLTKTCWREKYLKVVTSIGYNNSICKDKLHLQIVQMLVSCGLWSSWHWKIFTLLLFSISTFCMDIIRCWCSHLEEGKYLNSQIPFFEIRLRICLPWKQLGLGFKPY